jgi:hypothetical protein
VRYKFKEKSKCHH